MNAADDAVRLTIDRGCDTYVVVAHLETIRDMAKLFSYFGKIGTPYCIGSFDDVRDKNYHVQYNFSIVLPALCEKGVNFSSIPSTATPHNGKSSIIFLIPGYVHWFTCTNDSRLTHGNLGPQIL